MDRRTATDELWKSKPEIIRTFIEQRPSYEKLSEEVAFILESALRAVGIEFAGVTFRTKALDSFCEKVLRKKYEEPLKDITDFGGVRVVYLYKSDKPRIESIIEKQFIIREKNDTPLSSSPEQFGYGALHYLAKLTSGSTGARYDELRDLTCEIQVRTILQDGWAIIAHHLSYKQEADVPPELRRKLNALSGLFETADDQFDRVRDERSEYAERLKAEISTDSREFLDSVLNLDNLVAYLAWKLPDRRQSDRESVVGLLPELRAAGFEMLKQVDLMLDSSKPAFEAYEKKYPPTVKPNEKPIFLDVGVVRISLYLSSESARRHGDPEGRQRYEEFSPLLRTKPSK